jgi:hypothetical protein
VGFLNTSYKFSLLVFEVTKTRDVPGSLQKTRDILGTYFLLGHVSESGDCPREMGTSGNPNLNSKQAQIVTDADALINAQTNILT